MAQIIEQKDKTGENRLEVISKGRTTYKSTEGYKNKQDMIDAAVYSSVAILNKYAPEKLQENFQGEPDREDKDRLYNSEEE